MTSDGRPFFSIVIPVYDRAAVVGRALRSCVSQSFDDFEVIVVDDGSRDDTVAVIRGFDEPRIVLLRHEANRGRCPARNTGMAAARGEWFVFIDSDDELLPGALDAIHARAVAAPPSVGGLRFMCVDEYGTSPVPSHRDEILDYETYLRWVDAAIKQETLPCARVSTFPAVRYADSHASERWYHLELARTSLVQACHDVVRRYHHDIRDRITVPIAERSLRYAADEADDARQVLSVHGHALRRYAPRTYAATLANAATASFMAGRRMDGIAYAARAWPHLPFSPRLYVTTALGLAGRRPLARLQELVARLRSTDSR